MDTRDQCQPEKKGMTEKIKEKLPGGQKTDQHGQAQAQAQATTGGCGGTKTTTGSHEPEKKGMAEKIKAKVPGQH